LGLHLVGIVPAVLAVPQAELAFRVVAPALNIPGDEKSAHGTLPRGDGHHRHGQVNATQRRPPAFGFRVLGFGFRVLSFRLRVYGLGLGV